MIFGIFFFQMQLKPCLAIFYFLLLSIVSSYISPALGSDILRYKVIAIIVVHVPILSILVI